MAACSFTKLNACSSLLQKYCWRWKECTQNGFLNSSCVVSGVRYYRGSNRNTRKRERNLRQKLIRREATEPKVFDKKEFFRQNYDRELFSFKSRLGLTFNDDNTLLTALTHESFKADTINDDSGDNEASIQISEHNARLSLLGLTASSLYIVDHLCSTYPSLPRLGVRCFHDFLLGRSNIVKLAQQISLPDMIRLEHDLDDLHKEKHLDFRKEDVVCDTFFALVGAIHFDQGCSEARRFVEDFIITQLQGEELHKILHFDFPEKVLQNIFAIQGKEKPEARLIQQSGLNTLVPVYVVGVFTGDKMIAEASSYSQIRAKNEALKAALMKYCQEGMLQPFPKERKQLNKVAH